MDGSECTILQISYFERNKSFLSNKATANCENIRDLRRIFNQCLLDDNIFHIPILNLFLFELGI